MAGIAVILFHTHWGIENSFTFFFSCGIFYTQMGMKIVHLQSANLQDPPGPSSFSIAVDTFQYLKGHFISDTVSKFVTRGMNTL